MSATTCLVCYDDNLAEYADPNARNVCVFCVEILEEITNDGVRA